MIAKVVRSEHEHSNASLERLPELHALDRLQRGFDLRALAAEFAVLRRVTLDLWREHA